jgi:hypothetical protein
MNTLTAFAPTVNPAFEAIPAGQVGDDYRPTAGPDFIPTLEDEAQYLALLADDDARDEAMAEWAQSVRDEAMESAFGSPWDLISYDELVECGGFHPAAAYED